MGRRLAVRALTRGKESEAFQFALVRQDFQVRREGRLIFRDHFDWRGPWDQDAAAWHFGGANACGSLLVMVEGGGWRVEGKDAEVSCLFPPPSTLHPPPLEEARFTTAAGDGCFRWRGPSESVAAAVVQTALRLAPTLADGAGTAWLSGHDLAPCHWFSPVAAPTTRDQPV